MTRDNIFCQIVDGTAAASVIAGESGVLAFPDLNPVNPGHVLVVPRRHSTGLADLDPDVGAAMFRLAHRITAALRAADFGYAAFDLLLADGENAGQEVFHLHLHVIPRTAGDPMRITSRATRSSRANSAERPPLCHAPCSSNRAPR